MPLLDMCDNYDSCGGFCAPGQHHCPRCLKGIEQARKTREQDAEIRRMLDKLEQKPHRPAWRKLLGPPS